MESENLGDTHVHNRKAAFANLIAPNSARTTNLLLSRRSPKAEIRTVPSLHKILDPSKTTNSSPFVRQFQASFFDEQLGG
jgi:hypothetical protein